jgi:DNA-directed RNA polymerase subunit RPC12/RpoP
MDTFLISLLPLLVPFAFLLFQVLHRVKCPDCGETLPLFPSPFKKTRRMWRAGGYLCTRCGCETNMAGQKVTADTPPAPFPTLQCALLAVFLLVGVGLGASLIIVGERTAAAAVVAAPAVVEAPPPVIALPPAPAAAPVN